MRILVLGGSGWIGRAAVPILRERFDVEAPSSGDADVRSPDAVRDVVQRTRPEAVLQLSARNPPATDELLDAVNARGAGNVAAVCAEFGVPLLHMSTDLVLDGRAAPYDDDAPAAALGAYGRSKQRGEEAVFGAAAGRPAPAPIVIVRTSLVVDIDEPDRFTAACAARIARGEACTLFSDERRSAIDRKTLSRALGELLALLAQRSGDLPRRLNVACPRATSRQALGMFLMRRFGAGEDELRRLVREASARSAPEPRPLDLSLDVRRAQSLLETDLTARAEWTR